MDTNTRNILVTIAVIISLIVECTFFIPPKPRGLIKYEIDGQIKSIITEKYSPRYQVVHYENEYLLTKSNCACGKILVYSNTPITIISNEPLN